MLGLNFMPLAWNPFWGLGKKPMIELYKRVADLGSVPQLP
jgi:hypothetical protein